MPDKAPVGQIAPWRFDIEACRSDLDTLDALLTAQAELSEREDILPFFRDHPHLAAFLGSYNANVISYDRLGLEVPLFGQFVADLVVGDRTRRAYCFIEFEDGRSTSMFVRRGRHTTEWSPRFEHGMSQLVDWIWLLDDQERTWQFEDQFGSRPIDVVTLLVVGRDMAVSEMDRRRLQWRRSHVIANSQHMYCCTFDELLRDLRWRGRWSPWARSVPEPE
jgi:hypothetical protein